MFVLYILFFYATKNISEVLLVWMNLVMILNAHNGRKNM